MGRRWLSGLLAAVALAATAACEGPKEPVVEPSWEAQLPGTFAEGEYRSVPDPCRTVSMATVRGLVPEQPKPPAGVSPDPTPSNIEGKCRWVFRDGDVSRALEVKLRGYSAAGGKSATEVAGADFTADRWSAGKNPPVAGLGDQAAQKWYIGTDQRTATFTVRVKNLILDVRFESTAWWGGPLRALSMTEVERASLGVMREVLAGVQSGASGTAASPAPSATDLTAAPSACGAVRQETVQKLVFGSRENDRSPADRTFRSACVWQSDKDRLGLEVEVTAPSAVTGKGAPDVAADLIKIWREPPAKIASEPKQVPGIGDDTWQYHVRVSAELTEVFTFTRWRNLMVVTRVQGAGSKAADLEAGSLDAIRDVLAAGQQ
ncbi:hypothetical protein Val02_53360 [Virgisporangium aliadipatigenens]|uniref:DUF3558 domain-containing protein n=1 Tax=Virgisporangium aliadipatigenens TaxID=741659 RepID=A0A8J3YR43_9ACTN|nr:hypothetical protein [Virgisporangium aliadipatigenens]GIJ48450.1 hypothetical protein Val02_53360 [Virgisporangium aliadipatigenens]